MTDRQAVILAGGKGTRLLPYTTVFPKPLVPIGERPILEIIVEQLRAGSFFRLTFTVNHLAELIQAYFGDGEQLGVRIDYSLERQALGTAGPIGLLDELDDDFLIMNGDILTDMDYADLWQAHRASGAIATVATCAKQVPISLGVLEIGENDELVGYTEKPTLQYRVSMGIYVFQRRIKEFIPPDEHLDMPDLMKRLMLNGERVHCYDFQGRWLDIGNPDDYARANEEFATGGKPCLKPVGVP